MYAHQKLEEKFGEWMGYSPKQTVACNSGTAALHLALESLELPPGEVIVPEYTMIACARAVTLTGLKPVFVDCEDNLLFSQKKLSEKLTSKTQAIMPVHIYGRQCDVDQILHRNRSYFYGRPVPVVEDMAEIHGVKPHPESAAACWSFYRNKIVAGEEGGIICFQEERHADVARELRCQGFTPTHNFLHRPRGHNYRLADSLALLILHSLKKVEKNLLKRAQVVRWYDELIPRKWKMPPRESCWIYDLRILGLSHYYQQLIVDRLNADGIGARCGFRCMSEQPEYFDALYQSLNAYRLSSEVIYLPVFPEMNRGYVEDVVQNLLQVASSYHLI